MDFCKAFNDKTKDVEKGAPIPVVITAYKDRSFDFVTKLPPVSFYLKKAAKIKKGNSTPGRSLVGKVTSSDIEKIAYGRGLAYHIGPSNVPMNFAFSLFYSLLAGNPTIVRLPSLNFPQIIHLINLMNLTLVY